MKENNLISKTNNQPNLDSRVSNSLDCHEKPDEWWEIHNPEYIHYVYKITNKVNKMFYYGIHSIPKSLKKEPINDGYWGSGTGIREAIKEEGIENFTKEIVVILNTRQEIRKKEAEIVTIDLVKDPKCYNRVVGGGDSPLGKVCVFLKDDPTSKAFLIEKEEYYNNQEIYKTTTEQNVVVKLKGNIKESNWFIVTQEEYHQNKDKYETASTGKVCVYLIENGTVTNKIITVSQEEYKRYKNIKYISVGYSSTKGKVVVFDKNDPEKKAVCMDIDDPRYVSGKFIGITNGKKQSIETIAKKTGERNGSYGSAWITNGIENKKIYNDKIPEGWRKGRVFSQEQLNTIIESNRIRSNSIKTEVEVLNSSGKTVKTKLDPIFFRKDNNEIISPEYLQNLYNSLTTWNNVAEKLNIDLNSLRKVRKFYNSLGYTFNELKKEKN